ncbi:MAG: transpeptidase family protein [Bacteroidales bacterium]|nr:transpeptidase family protein [Bacteroidales bacterium]
MNGQNDIRDTEKKRDRIGNVLYYVYVLLLLAAVAIFVKIVGIQLFYRPASKIEAALRPQSVVRVLEPVRGNILDSKGRLLAMSYPVYDIHMDCTVQKVHFSKMPREKGSRLESEWLEKARALSDGLAEILPAKSAQAYFEAIRAGRTNGSKYLLLARGVDHKTLLRIQGLPLFREGRNKGGLITEQRNVRRYPYGALARRTIGFVRDNSATGVRNTHIGLEGRFDYFLHGKDGRECLRQTDYGRVRDFDSSYVRAVDGKDLVSTLDIDLQDVADKALRDQIMGEDDLEGACLVLMEVKTGAIRAMVNLFRDPDRENAFEEITNLAVGRKGEPGSVFKTVTLMTVLSDGVIHSLEETIPTRHGHVAGTQIDDQHIRDYEREKKRSEISIIDGFKMSSNYVFATLAIDNYGESEAKTMQFIEKIYSYKLGETFDFDLDGLAAPTIPTPKSRYWIKGDLGSMGFGYNTEETPLHILTFYNAIANKGRMMKPYLVERIGRDENRGPSVLNASVCSPAVADTLTRALKAVTEEGTARVLKNAACAVAGKTGTSFGTFENGAYKDAYGRRKYQGTFAGFFPADSPRYSIICTVYSKPTGHSYQGGGIPARAVKTVVNHICNTDPEWYGSLERSGELPLMKTSVEPAAADDSPSTVVPALSGLGLKDALYLAGRAGLECQYSGSGHVRSQQPRAGETVKKGSILKLELK